MSGNRLGSWTVALTLALLAACAPSSLAPTLPAPTPAGPLTETPSPVPTPTPIDFWNEIQLITHPQGFRQSNSTDEYGGMDVPQSYVSLQRDTRWVVDLQVDPLEPYNRDSSTGISLQGIGDDGSRPVLFWVYQSGGWNLGYAPVSEPDYTFNQFFDQLTNPSQQFEIRLSNGGRTLAIQNNAGFHYQHEFSTPLFEHAKQVGLALQWGPHTTLTITSLSILQKQADQVTVASLPTPLAAQDPNFEYVLHVSPAGSDANPGTAEAPFATLEHAREVVRLLNSHMTGSILVVLHGGTYPMTSPIQFDAQDSGNHGYRIIYRAADGETPVLSGGVKVVGWQPVPDRPIWKTILPPDTQLFRQLYVNGVRAQRAASEQTLTGLRYAPDRDGIEVPASDLPDLARPQDLELHWIYDWKDMRLRVRAIEDNPDGTKTLRMLQPYYSYALAMGSSEHKWVPAYNIPFYLENALELLDQPGEWYYNPDSHELFYWPRPGEALATATAVIPQTESLLEVTGGALGQEVHDLEFDGLTFAYAGWTRASEVGTFGWQAQDLINKPGQEVMTPAHVYLSSARQIWIENCRFLHLGAAGLGLGNNTEEITVQGNLFHDISDAAIVVGHWDDAYITAPLFQAQPRNNTIEDNLIDQIGVEYWGAAGINAYYVENLRILHNTLSNLPYSGISVGWGWSSVPDSTTSNLNQIAYNLITDLAQRARDAGGIYTLGQQPGTMIEGNVVRRMKGDYACFYTDEGSAFITLQNNVCDSAPEWLDAWTNNIHDNHVRNTYTNVQRLRNRGTNIGIENTVYVNSQDWPAEAQAIMDQAGLEPQFDYLFTWLENAAVP